MRMLWYWPWPAQRGVEVAAALAAAGDHVVLECFAGSPVEPLPPAPPGVELLADLARPSARQDRSPLWAIDRLTLVAGRARRRARAVRTANADVVHVHLLHHVLDPWSIGRIGRARPLVSTVHDVVPHQSRLPSAIERRALLRLYAQAGHLVVHHQVLADRLAAEWDVDPGRLSVVPLPISAPVTTEARRPRDAIVFFGAFRRNKGIDVLLRAAPALGEHRLVIAGRGVAELERAVQDAAVRLPQIEARVGYVTEAEKASLLSEAALLVLPYTAFASQSAVLHDAYAHGVPVVVTDVGALGATVRAEGTGWVVPPGDDAALSAAITTALGDPVALAARSAAARAVGAERTPAAVAERLRAIYRGVAG